MLPLGDIRLRQALVGISYSTAEGVVCRKMDDERLILPTVPSKVKGVSIHRRMMIENNLIDPIVVSNICLKCTFIADGGKEHLVYRQNSSLLEVK